MKSIKKRSEETDKDREWNWVRVWEKKRGRAGKIESKKCFWHPVMTDKLPKFYHITIYK